MRGIVMAAYRCLILPSLADETFTSVDLDAETSEYTDVVTYGSSDSNPYENAEVQELLLDRTRAKYGTRTIGGYLEDRVTIWAGLEPQSTTMVHLGVDVNNLSEGDPVCVPCDCTVVHVLRDPATSNGWGGRLIFQLAEPFGKGVYLLYGHLRHDLPDVGTVFKKGDIVGYVGGSEVNGGWFKHLHVQLLTQEAFDRDIDNLDRVDGYILDGDASRYHAPLTAGDLSVDPMPLICYPVVHEREKRSLQHYSQSSNS